MAMVTRTVGRPRVRDLVIAAVWYLGGSAEKDYVHKLLYIVGKIVPELIDPVFLGFENYEKGPWSEAVADVMDMLVDEGVLQYDGNRVILRDHIAIREVLSRIPDVILVFLEYEGDILSKLTHEELLLYIHIIHDVDLDPKIKERLLSRRIQLAANMLQKGAVFTSVAARLAGMNYIEFVRYLKKKGIKPFVADERDLDLLPGED